MVLTTPESIIEQASTVNLLDDLINESVRTSARRPIMMQFDPSSGWIWRRWKGTVFAETWISCVRNMLFAVAVYLFHKSHPHIFQTHLSGFNTLWGQLLSVTTFTLTFFVNQSYALWRKCMELSRRLQGRLHDVNMNLASHARRVIPSNPNEKSTYTASSRQILELMSRYTRLFNLLTYASFTRSHRPILTPRGLRRLVERGLMTPQEREVLVDAVIPATQRHSVVLMWMIRLFVEGRESGHIQGGHGFESETMHKFHIIRSQYGAIGDELQGRMPLAYAHIVQVLVDLILWMFPFMAFTTGMSPLLVIFGTGLLTISYQGLFDLAKQFLDPYDNENYGRGDDPLCVDTLIAETNAGSIRWLYGFEELPYSPQRLKDGELYEYLLPVRGYSVEELDQMEKEQIKREKQLEEQRKREEEEAAAAEEERLRKEAEEILEADIEEEEQETIEHEHEEEDELERLVEKEEEADVQTAENTETTFAELVAADVDIPVESLAAIENKTIAAKDRKNVATSIETVSNVTRPTAASEDFPPDGAATDSDSATSPTKEKRSVHKVTTLATDKSAVVSSFKPSQPIKEVSEEPVPSGMTTSNYLATLRMQNEKIKALLAAAELNEDYVEEDEDEMIDFEALGDLPWFDEVGSDGQELRLSQQLADEVWEVEKDDIQIKNMTKEEYEARLKEIEEQAENELQETIEIMSAIPGAEGDEKLYTVAERKKKKAPTYDQTRLDGISQLWGLPPEDLSALREYEPPEKIDDVDFSAVSQLWGGKPSGSTGTQTSTQDESDVVGMKDFSGISELWGSAIDDFRDDSESQGAEPASGKQGTPGGEQRNEDGDSDFPSFAGLPWHDEKGPDGKEYRLSQLLADEEWVTETEPEEAPPMTLEDYNKEVEKIITKAEEELRETEAILLSKPGTDPVGWDYDDEQLAPMSNVTNSEESEEEEIVEDADLDVLEMDVDDDYSLPAMQDGNIGISYLDGGNRGNEFEVLLAEDTDLMSSEIRGSSDETVQDASAKSGGDPENNAATNDDQFDSKDKIEPIFIEEQEENLAFEEEEEPVGKDEDYDSDLDDEDDLRL
eukprot:jgi/Psemu1/324327/estExt_fgenesh1_pg.C_1340022